MMRYEVHTQHDWAGRTIEVALVTRERNATYIARVDDLGFLSLEEITDPAAHVDPTIRLPVDEARELYLQLGRIIGAGEHGHDHTREDYLHERARVDTLIAHVLGPQIPQDGAQA